MIRKSHASFLVLGLLAAGLLATSARADVTYTFTGINDSHGNGQEPVAFQFTASTFVTSITSLLQSQLSSCTNCQSSPNPDVIFAPNVPFLGAVLQFNDSNNVSSFYEFSPGSFGAVGTYNSGGFFNPTGRLTVAVPEPSSAALTFGGGIMLALFALFRRRNANAPQLA